MEDVGMSVGLETVYPSGVPLLLVYIIGRDLCERERLCGSRQ